MRGFLKLYDDYFDDVYRYVHFRIGHTWDADDLVSDIFRKILEYTQSHGGRAPEHERAWVFTIARNRVIDHYRRKKETTYGQDPEAVAGYEHIRDVFKQSELVHDCLEEALCALEPADCERVQFKYMVGMTYEEIGQITGQDIGWLRTRVHRVRKRLAVWMERCIRGVGER